MPNPNLRLDIRSPTPSTRLYTVTDAPPRPTTLFARSYHYFSLICVASITLLCVFSLSLLYLDLAAVASWIQHPFAYPFRLVLEIHYTCSLKFSYPGRWWIAFALHSLVSCILCARSYQEEQILFMRSLGIQISTSSFFIFQRPATRFIPAAKVRDVLIHEGFRGFEVRFYLAIVVDGEETVTVVFPQLLPSLEILVAVWRGSREVLEWKKEST